VSFRRTWAVAAVELRHTARRPLFWIFVLILLLITFGMSTGGMTIQSGEGVAGGTRSWQTSEFSVSMTFAFLTLLLYGFFVAVGAGMTIPQDDEHRVGPVLHATPLAPREYVLGKFAAVMLTFGAVLAIHVLLMMLFHYVVPSAAAAEIRGPFALAHYLRPALVFALPTVFFFAGTSFGLGAATRRPILVFFVPVAVMLVSGFFLWEWSPSWLDPAVDRFLMVLDPAGFRWLNGVWLKVDRGVDFYNAEAVGYDVTFLLNRLILIAAGLVGVAVALRAVGREARGAEVAPRRRRGVRDLSSEPAVSAAPTLAFGRGTVGSSGGPIGFLAGAWTIAKAELRELRQQPGLYLFIPLLLLQTFNEALLKTGPFDTPMIHTAGSLAAATQAMLTSFVCLLLLFYVVETMERERRSGFAPVFLATPVSTASILAGKALALAGMVATVLAAGLVAGLAGLAIQGGVAIDPVPFLLVWGLLVVPSLVVFGVWVAFVHALFRNRYASYAMGLAALALTLYRLERGKMNWVENWPLWGSVRWSDVSVLELDRGALVLNRILWLGVAALLGLLTLRLTSRTEADLAGLLSRMRPRRLLRGAVRLAPLAAVPLVAGMALSSGIAGGSGGEGRELEAKNYWRRNVATWTDALLPNATAVELDLDLDPAAGSVHSRGTMWLRNTNDVALRQIPLTRGFDWTNVSWILDGAAVEPEDRAGLLIFEPASPLAPGESLEIGWELDARVPGGWTKNGGGAQQFVLPTGVFLSNFDPTMMPVVGYMAQVGVDRENRFDGREYPPDHHVGRTRAWFGTSDGMTTRVRISGPPELAYNSVGVRTLDEVIDGRRVTEWRSDHPVKFLNVVAGRWERRDGDGVEVYYDPADLANIDEITATLAASRRWYGEWFAPFPWRTLKLSEYPNHAGSAWGFPTNIAFSEGIGFRTKSDPRSNMAFLVTAHEAAHQWWGNMILPGEGPGGDVLSEGMSHFSTMLLFEQVKGPEQRIEFAKRIETRYARGRHRDAERPLTRIDGTRPGDTTVTYDKGGWVMWMLLREMGRENALAGLADFIRRYETSPDHPVLEDLVDVLREHAADREAYDAFVAQWFHDVVVPEYRLDDVRVEAPIPDGRAWTVTADLSNVGSGVLPVEVAATRGVRFPSPGEGATEPYREARIVVRPAAGEADRIEIACDFEPERLVVDPDAQVLMLRRESAAADL